MLKVGKHEGLHFGIPKSTEGQGYSGGSQVLHKKDCLDEER